MNGTSVSLESSRPPGNAEKAFAFLVLLLSAGAFLNLTVTGPIVTQNTGMLGMQILWSFLYVITLVLFFRHFEKPLRTLFVVSPLIMVLGFAFASVFWSQDPGLTLRRATALGLSLIFGVYLASRFSQKEQFRLLAWAFGVCIGFSFLFELLGLNPSQGYPGWYGVFDIKNELGQAMVLSVLVFLFWRRIEPEHKTLAWTGVSASVLLLALSRGMTAVVVFIVLMLLLPYLQWTSRKSVRGLVGGITLLLAVGMLSVFYIATHLEDVAAFLGKDPDLTGRVPLWIVVTVMALQRPWLGYGFNAFWLPDQAYTSRIWRLLTWAPPQAHNGILELWLELGLIGTVLFFLVYGYYVARALSFSRHNSEPAAIWPIAFLIFLFLANLTTAFFLQGNNIYFILYVALATTMYRSGNKTLSANRLGIPGQNHA
jgi:exopolysaccharide production protein ExoQ